MNVRRELVGLAYLFLAAFLFLAVFSFDPGDPTFNQAVTRGWKIRNLAGAVGSYFVGLLIDLFGRGAYVCPFYFLYLGLCRFLGGLRMAWWRWTGFFCLWLCLMAWSHHPWFFDAHAASGGVSGGGFVGNILIRWTSSYLRPAGSFLFWLFVSLAGLQLLLGLSWESMGKRLRGLAADWLARRHERREREARRNAVRLSRKAAPRRAPEPEREQEDEPEDEPAPLPLLEELEEEPVLRPFDAEPKPKPKPAKPARPKAAKNGIPAFPGLDLLAVPPKVQEGADPKVLQAQAKQLGECLANFNVQGEIQQVVPGPVVTMFEYKPAPGVKISRIAALSDDIALALKATAVRIEAPIPGKDSVGVEIPNPKRQTVYLREILESSAFRDAASPLTIALGKDIQGQPQVADLAKMPHLLVAGATGAGKSVCLNGILLSILYKATPEQVRFLLVDPKRIELALYSDMPHLVHPVVTDMALAKSALEWATFEMDRRYECMARLGARNIEGYNQKLSDLGDARSEELADLAAMPYLVIIIDELADLMMTAAKDVEMSIVRPAQLARAAGIHMILATQRPSVDVVTGLIKANFPTRISFQVTSKHDSRTILDTVGSERLLGRGDMLFKPSGSKLKRMHGAFVDEAECQAVVDFWKESCPKAEFAVDFADWKKEAGVEGENGEGGDNGMADDPHYLEAKEFVISQGKASISLIQRRFRIGFNRAARFIEQMEREGLLGPQDGAKPRTVIRKD
ncbi:DNA translocase FtsK 4TM domain-containing protein [Desulfovibrio sp.]